MRSSIPTNDGGSQEERPRALSDGSARFSRRILIAAFLISLLVHAIVATGVHYDVFRPKEDVTRVTIESRPRLLHVEQRTPQPPTPPPQTPPPSPVPTSASTTAPTKPIDKNGTRAVGPRSAATPRAAPPSAAPSAAPAATPGAVTAACVNRDAPAALAATPDPPALSSDIRHAAVSGIAKVVVKLDQKGQVTDAAMQISTGNPAADIALVSMARNAQYTPALKDCKPIPGEYVLAVRLAPW